MPGKSIARPTVGVCGDILGKIKSGALLGIIFGHSQARVFFST
jgi:hypothetical protein